MIELIYVSRALKRFNAVELQDMLTHFRKNNEKLGITGLFLYDGKGTFIQVLEGDADTVHSLFNNISLDERHSRINVLGDREISSRNFPDWCMGFKHLEESPAQGLKGYSNFLEQPERIAYLNENPSFAVDLLEHFKV